MSNLDYTKIDFLIANPKSKVYHSWNCKSARKTIKNPLIIDSNNRAELKQLNGFKSCGNCQPEPLTNGMDFFGDLANNNLSQSVPYREPLMDLALLEDVL